MGRASQKELLNQNLSRSRVTGVVFARKLLSSHVWLTMAVSPAANFKGMSLVPVLSDVAIWVSYKYPLPFIHCYNYLIPLFSYFKLLIPIFYKPLINIRNTLSHLFYDVCIIKILYHHWISMIFSSDLHFFNSHSIGKPARAFYFNTIIINPY